MPKAFLPNALLHAFNDAATDLRGRIIGIYGLLIAANVAAWAWALSAFHDYPVLLGTAFLAYSFGLRHAVNADHIAAIDNVTRKLMQERKHPITAGLFFSLGHSTVVVLASIGVAVTAAAFKDRLEDFHSIGGVIGTAISAVFLLLIATINIVILINVYRAFRRVKDGGAFADQDLDLMLAGGGLFARLCRSLFRLIERSWHMYPLGLLFGLGFDTATEVALLVLAGTGAASGLPFYAILCLPILFAAGMSLLDTIDGSFMNFAYGWAFSRPVRKVYYNLTITGLSVAVALVIGTVELGGLLAERLSLSGSFWRWFEGIDINLLGFVIVGMFVLTWGIALAIWRFGRIEERWTREPNETPIAGA